MFDKRIAIFTGHFGSGKPRWPSIMPCRPREGKDCHSRLDIVNPFFRTADARHTGSRGHQGDHACVCEYECGCTLLPPEISSMFEDRS